MLATRSRRWLAESDVFLLALPGNHRSIHQLDETRAALAGHHVQLHLIHYVGK